jgi:hypothetical protein
MDLGSNGPGSFASLSLSEPPIDKWLTEEPSSNDAAERQTETRQDSKVKSLMTLTVSGDLLSVVENAATAKQAFRGLQALCVKAEQVRRSCPDFLAGKPPVRFSHHGGQGGHQQGRETNISNEQLLDALAQWLQLNPQRDPPPLHNAAPGAGSARMYAVTAIAGRGDDESLTEDPATMWLDGGSTHHIVCSQDHMINFTASPVSSVLAAGGESHEVLCCDVLCVPTFKKKEFYVRDTTDVPRS